MKEFILAGVPKQSKVDLQFHNDAFLHLDFFLSLIFVRRPLCPITWSESQRLICVKVLDERKLGSTFEYWVSSVTLLPIDFRVDSRLLSAITTKALLQLSQYELKVKILSLIETCDGKQGTQWRRQTPRSSERG